MIDQLYVIQSKVPSKEIRLNQFSVEEEFKKHCKIIFQPNSGSYISFQNMIENNNKTIF